MNFYDVIVIGAGFFGLRTALFFAKINKKVLILESNSKAFQNASLINQARVHNGYHYPRSYPTALSSHNHYEIFCEEYKTAISGEFKKIYAIAQKNSYINANQFENFCNKIQIPLKEATSDIKGLFNRNLIENVYLTKEVAFNAYIIKEILLQELSKFSNVEIKYNTSVNKIEKKEKALVLTQTGEIYSTDNLFNITYASINNLLQNSNFSLLDFKLEFAEIALIKPPKELKTLGITIMDGEYWSSMPFPTYNCHSLSHVRYTPHYSWFEKEKCINPYELLKIKPQTKSLYMIKDASRYVPIIDKAEYIKSLYTIKTIVSRNEDNDGRPIVIKKHNNKPNIYSILGSKIDNIYDLENYLKEIYE
ncbi:FAD-dependent oxidoreductase [Aliarcobacter vitoriensis]|uniref:Amino acid oxidase n=1 Tax=Aliarcobacter vitoriensis TaxID=2011099 RepID=A0A366MSN0_9BACT|nr:FAD-dependent oxidoreductase [Aliarcobacter vitoriensis]RBQ29245.1 amino acid oxidase [Aliarcobacter vitoriensis]